MTMKGLYGGSFNTDEIKCNVSAYKMANDAESLAPLHDSS